MCFADLSLIFGYLLYLEGRKQPCLRLGIPAALRRAEFDPGAPDDSNFKVPWQSPPQDEETKIPASNTMPWHRIFPPNPRGPKLTRSIFNIRVRILSCLRLEPSPVGPPPESAGMVQGIVSAMDPCNLRSKRGPPFAPQATANRRSVYRHVLWGACAGTGCNPAGQAWQMIDSEPTPNLGPVPVITMADFRTTIRPCPPVWVDDDEDMDAGLYIKYRVITREFRVRSS